MLLFLLTRWVGRPRPVITAMAFPGAARSSTKRFRSLLACATTLPSFINVIMLRLLWYIIPLSHSWPNEMRFKSHWGANATLWSSIVVPPASGIATVPILLVLMICPAAVIKSMLFAWVFLNKLRLLHKCRDAQESRNQVLAIDFCKDSSLAMHAFPTGPGVNGLGSDSSFSAA